MGGDIVSDNLPVALSYRQDIATDRYLLTIDTLDTVSIYYESAMYSHETFCRKVPFYRFHRRLRNYRTTAYKMYSNVIFQSLYIQNVTCNDLFQSASYPYNQTSVSPYVVSR